MKHRVRSWWVEGEPWFLAVGLANLVLGTSSVLVPLALRAVLGRSVDSLGVLSSLVSVMGVAGSLVWGKLSDVANRRKPFVLLSYTAVAILLGLMGFARSFEQLVVLNMALNFFWVANASVTVLIVIENKAEGTWEKKIGHMNQIGALGWVFGLLVGSGALAVAGRLASEATAIRSTFVLLGVLGLVAALLAAKTIPAGAARFFDRAFRGAAVSLGNFLVEFVRYGPLHLYYRLPVAGFVRYVLKMRAPRGLRTGTKRFLLATLLAFIGLGMFGIPLPLLLAERFGIPSSSVFLYFAVQNAAVVVAYPLATRRIHRTGNLRVQRAALAVRLVLFAGAAVALSLTRVVPPAPLLVAIFAAYGFTWSYFQLSGVAITSRLARPENRGLALGVYNGLAGTGWILAGAGSGFLARWAGYEAAFGASAFFLLLTLVVLRFVPEPGSEAKGSSESRVMGTESAPAPTA
ncbi:MAG: MFS transporter [Candidatus Bipolaricaulota bacterium]